MDPSDSSEEQPELALAAELQHELAVEALKDDLLLKKLRDFELDIEMAEAMHQNGVLSPKDAKALVQRAIRAVGKKQAVSEQATRVRVQVEEARHRADAVRCQNVKLADGIAKTLGPVFMWAWNVQEKYERLFGTEAEGLLSTIQKEAEAREDHGMNVLHRIINAQQTSADLLNSMRQIHRGFKAEVVKVRAQRETELATTQEMWEESLHDLLNEDAHLSRINKEIKFHLKRGSNYKQPLQDEHLWKLSSSNAKPGARVRGEVSQESIPTEDLTQDEEIAAQEASSRLAHRKLEEIELAERALQRDQQQLDAVLSLVARRRGEREELVAVCDALSREVDYLKGTLSQSGVHPASVRRGVSPSPSTVRRRAASPTPTRSVRRGVSPGVHSRAQSPSPSPFTPRRRVPFNQSGPNVQPPPPQPQADPVPLLSTHFVRDRQEPHLQLRTSGELTGTSSLQASVRSGKIGASMDSHIAYSNPSVAPS